MEEITLKAKDNYELSLAICETEHPRGYVQVIHGMEEHKERYESFAKYLASHGYTVITSDMRGHGTNAPQQGFFQEKDGADYLLADQKQITAYIKERFGTEQVILFAHSMGTIIARNLLQTEARDYAKMILSGYPYYPGKAMVAVGSGLAKCIGAIKGKHYYSKLVEKLVVGAFNHSIRSPKTSLDWLSYNEENVQAYIADPLCGYGFTTSAFVTLFELNEGMAQVERYRDVQAQLPILLLCGEDDPCTGGTKGRTSSLATLQQAGYQKITSITYPNMRHEILNENGREQVYEDVVEFLQK